MYQIIYALAFVGIPLSLIVQLGLWVSGKNPIEVGKKPENPWFRNTAGLACALLLLVGWAIADFNRGP